MLKETLWIPWVVAKRRPIILSHDQLRKRRVILPRRFYSWQNKKPERSRSILMHRQQRIAKGGLLRMKSARGWAGLGLLYSLRRQGAMPNRNGTCLGASSDQGQR